MSEQTSFAPWQQRVYAQAAEALDAGRLPHGLLFAGPARLGIVGAGSALGGPADQPCCCGSRRKISTRRFLALPSVVALLAMGSREPRPAVSMRLPDTPRSTR